jgi:hypothetical protein
MTRPCSGGAVKWRRVDPTRPCPICGRPDRCSLSADGALAKCTRTADGAWKVKKDKNGAEYYLHRLDGAATAPAVPPPPPDDRAAEYVLHPEVYTRTCIVLLTARINQCREELEDLKLRRRVLRLFRRWDRANEDRRSTVGKPPFPADYLDETDTCLYVDIWGWERDMRAWERSRRQA